MNANICEVGLESPAKILADELDAVKLQMFVYEKRQIRLLQGTPSRALLEEPDEGKDDIEIVSNTEGVDAGEVGEHDDFEIVENSEEDDVEEDSILYESGV